MKAPALWPEFVVLVSIILILPAIDLDLSDRILAPHGRVEHLVLHTGGDKQMQAPALWPEFVVLVSIILILPAIDLDLGHVAALPGGRIKQFIAPHPLREDRQPPSIWPKLIIMGAEVGISPVVDLRLVRTGLPPHGGAVHLRVAGGLRVGQCYDVGLKAIKLRPRADIVQSLVPPEKSAAKIVAWMHWCRPSPCFTILNRKKI